jgi:hypothetical protein
MSMCESVPARAKPDRTRRVFSARAAVRRRFRTKTRRRTTPRGVCAPPRPASCGRGVRWRLAPARRGAAGWRPGVSCVARRARSEIARTRSLVELERYEGTDSTRMLPPNACLAQSHLWRGVWDLGRHVSGRYSSVAIGGQDMHVQLCTRRRPVPGSCPRAAPARGPARSWRGEKYERRHARDELCCQ